MFLDKGATSDELNTMLQNSIVKNIKYTVL